MKITIDGQVALITGGSRGIGEATAREFLASGAAGVAITGRNQDNLDAAAEGLDAGARVMTVVARADEETAADETTRSVIERFGSLDVLINNAGTNPAAGNLAEVELSAIDKTWAVNQRGPLIWSREAWRQWMQAHGGVIVNVASAGGLRPAPLAGAYYTSKAAVIEMTRELATEWGPGVRVNAVAPSVVRTRLSRALWDGIEDAVSTAHPLGRIGEPEDVAAAILFLASAKSISGVTLPVDGGALIAANFMGLSQPSMG